MNQPVYEWSTLKLKASGNKGDDYVWSGPTGNGTGQEYEIITTHIEQSGTYVVNMSDGICPPVSNSVVVNVLPLPIPCDVDENTLLFQDAADSPFPVHQLSSTQNGIFNEWISDTNDLQLRYVIRIRLNFPNDGVNRSYDRSFRIAQDVGAALYLAEISILDRGKSPAVSYNAISGQVYMRRAGDKLKVYFCEVPFEAPGAGNRLVSTQLSVPFIE